MTLYVELDSLPPFLNHAYPTVMVKGQARRILSREAAAWKGGATLLIRSAAACAGFSLPPKMPYTVEAEFYSPRRWGWDVDGRAKLLLDAISDALGVDDRYVAELTLRKYAATEERTRVFIGNGPAPLAEEALQAVGAV